uniref:Kinesin family member 6 n=1 Tax=Neogobius melanostomus TaxID=47308 RepID=A0A8C6UZB7_9GOBI
HCVQVLLCRSKVYSVDNEQQTGPSLEFVVPKDLAQGFINNKKESYRFRFQKIFDQSTKQEEIFENIAKPVAHSVLTGYNGTIFAYGQTGSGKTFTITGGAERYNDRGLVPRILSYLYECFSLETTMVYTTHVSYLEIYNDSGYDLLSSRQKGSGFENLPKVVIMEDPEQNIHLKNLSLLQSVNEEEALNLLFLGETNRMIAETPMNQASTRSHCIFTVHLCRREPGSATVHRSKLHLVDLAGSDRVSKTGLNGQLLTEAKYINVSLHYLEQVIIALSEKNRSHIPYRNSMLTSVLRDSLGGNCMTTMIATVAVERRNIDESISTCRFAQRVSLINNEAVVNEELDPALIAHLKREIQCLKAELSMVTGVQREEQLTEDEKLKLEELLKAFLDDPNPEVSLNLGPDMRKIQHCYSRLKVQTICWIILTSYANSFLSHLKTEVIELKEMLKQRDNEISILYLKPVVPKLFVWVAEWSRLPYRLRLIEHYRFLLTNVLLICIVSYISTLDRLKVLNTEIEHLQLLLKWAKVKQQRDSQKCWSEEASLVQVSNLYFLLSILLLSFFTVFHSTMRDQSTTNITPFSIPLTGDEKADADIRAFVKARERLLQKSSNWSL